MSRFDFAGEFRREGTGNNGGSANRANEIRSGPAILKQRLACADKAIE
jgi:hypothetical protein